MGTAVASYVLLGVGAAGTAYSIYEQKKASEKMEDQMRQQNRLEQKRADMATARERAKQLRQARAQRAAALAAAQTGEGTGGSGLLGTQQNINAQLGSNLAFLRKNQDISTQLSNLNVNSQASIARSQTRASYGSGVASIAGAAGDVFG